MVKILFFAVLALVAVSVFSAPAEEQGQFELFEPTENGVRLPRATCDLLSAFEVADSACAAHCIAKKFRGGWCDKGVCHCRR